MSTKIDDGGPAFAAVATSPMGDVHHQEGMSLRDWFAGQASEGDIERHCSFWQGDLNIMLTREEAKYAYADAMLAARSKAEGSSNA